jgi:hypothetical protein
MLKNQPRQNLIFDRTLTGIVVPGYGVASGRSADSPYPAGTIAMQAPLFRALGFDLDGYFLGTLNLSIAPNTFKPLNPDYRFDELQWAEGFPPETFSFYRCQIQSLEQNPPKPAINAWIYYPHPETKIGHFQPNNLLEIIAPPLSSVQYGDRMSLRLSSQQIQIKP